MGTKRGVDPAIVAALRSIAKAPVGEVGKAAAGARMRLPAHLLAGFLTELAEMNIDQLVRLLDLPADSRPEIRDAAPVAIAELELSGSQAARFRAWVDEQRELAVALQIPPDDWGERLEIATMAVRTRLQRAAAPAHGPAFNDSRFAKVTSGLSARIASRAPVGVAGGSPLGVAHLSAGSGKKDHPI